MDVYVFLNGSVESNDRLYIGDEDFRTEMADHCSQLLNELLNDLNQLDSENQYRRQVIAHHLKFLLIAID